MAGASDAVAKLEQEADRTEKVVARAIRALRKRRPLINNDRDLARITITIKLRPSSGNLRSLTVDFSSEENLDRDA